MSYLTDPFSPPVYPPPAPPRAATYAPDEVDARHPGDRDDERLFDDRDADTPAEDTRAQTESTEETASESGSHRRRRRPTRGGDTTDAETAPPGADIDAEEAAPVVLTQPAEGLPDVVEDEHTLLEAAHALRAGTGPFAVDAERASGYRYGQRAYLVQVRREGAGTWLIDPVACPDLGPINDAVEGVEWILHAATQDLGCLREVGLAPSALFDTELGARLAGLPRVGLAAVIEHYLGFSLAKEHSAVDWSTRPLPEDWLRYAALDVECLAEVRDAMADDLESQGKAEWARQEFEALTSFMGHPGRVDPWRRVSGLRRLRTPRNAAIVRELWYARDDLARRRDVSPGRVAPDAVLVALAAAAPTDVDTATAATSHKAVKRHPEIWVDAVRRAQHLPEEQLPPVSLPAQGPPPPKSWADRDPLAAARLAMTRKDLAAFAETHRLPLENLLSPDTLRRALWTPPQDGSEASFEATLLDLGARAWQAEIAAPVLARAFAEARPA